VETEVKDIYEFAYGSRKKIEARQRPALFAVTEEHHNDTVNVFAINANFIPGRCGVQGPWRSLERSGQR
jgi:hypothetical protein